MSFIGYGLSSLRSITHSMYLKKHLLVFTFVEQIVEEDS
jgi:hypothetical protein